MPAHDVEDMPAEVEECLECLGAVQVLAHSPMIGRPVKQGKQELVIAKRTRGHMALYE